MTLFAEIIDTEVTPKTVHTKGLIITGNAAETAPWFGPAAAAPPVVTRQAKGHEPVTLWTCAFWQTTVVELPAWQVGFALLLG